MFFMSPDGAMLTELVTLISQGTIKTVIDSTYPMEQASEAFGLIRKTREKSGGNANILTVWLQYRT